MVLRTLAERYDISPSQIVTFGDDYNDIDMLRLCGIKVTVKNARPEVKKGCKRNNPKQGAGLCG